MKKYLVKDIGGFKRVGVVPPLDTVESGGSDGSEAGLRLFLQGGLYLFEQLCTARECFMHKSGHFHGIYVSM
jgi:hypothetical protein